MTDPKAAVLLRRGRFHPVAVGRASTNPRAAAMFHACAAGAPAAGFGSFDDAAAWLRDTFASSLAFHNAHVNAPATARLTDAMEWTPVNLDKGR